MLKYLAILCLMISVFFDDKVFELTHYKSTKFIQIEKILGYECNEKWYKDRYFKIKIIRYLILLVLVYDPKIVLISVFILCLLIYFYPVLKLNQFAKLKIRSIQYHFPIYLRQIQVLLQNNTVVRSIELSLEYVPKVLKPDIERLNELIKEDPMNSHHYINCMKDYDLIEIQRSMKWLYRYQNFGYKDAYSQFNRMLMSTSKWLRQSRIEQKQSSIQVYQWMGMLPLLGVTFVFISAMMSVVISLFERG